MRLEIIETDRLILRMLSPKVLKFFHESYSDYKIMEVLGLHSKEELEWERYKYKEGLWMHNKKFLYF